MEDQDSAKRLPSDVIAMKEELMTLTSVTKDSISLAWRHVEIVDATSLSSSSSSTPSSSSSSSFSSTPPSSLLAISSVSPSSSSSSFSVRPKLTGYQIIYQATGSNLVQSSRTLPPGMSSHVIGNLHESTIYDVCLVAHFTLNSPSSSSLSSSSSSSSSSSLTSSSSSSLSLSSSPSSAQPGVMQLQEQQTSNTTIFCLQASTVTESFAMMVGSTLGAFLALAIVVSIVYLAKRQRRHKKKYPGYSNDPRFAGEEGAGSLGLEEAILRMGDSVFLQVYKQRIPRLKTDTQTVAEEENGDDLVVFQEGEGSESFVLMSIDDALKLVESGNAIIEDPCQLGEEEEEEEEEDNLDGEIEESNHRKKRNSSQDISYDWEKDGLTFDPKTLIENAYMVKL